MDPRVLQDILTSQWAACELGGASYLMETYHCPPPENPYLEIDPIPWQTSPLSEGPRPVPWSCTASSIATSVETQTISTVGPSASMATDQAPEGLHNAPPPQLSLQITGVPLMKCRKVVLREMRRDPGF